jgi:glucose/arabinose dehydrogenase
MSGKDKRMRIILGVVLVAATAAAGGSWLVKLNPGAWVDQLTSADDPEAGPVPAIELVNAFPELKFELPLWFGHAGDGSGNVYVVEQDGRIWRFKNDAAAKERTLVLDLSERVPSRRKRHNEEGLLALVFHPKFKSNGLIYVNYSQLKDERKPRRGVLSRFKVGESGTVALDTEEILLEVEQPWGNHNGCDLHFGADGYLYATFGDGGAAADPHNAAQNLKSHLGKVLRIDVDRKDEGKPYAIPKDNPFVDKDALPEIWAYGLRNVWRMSFDAETGLLWGGDVGQNAWEEIDIIEKGGNYGWRAREGKHDFRQQEVKEGMIDPVIDYPRDKGISVTGGWVYRGKKHDALNGVYFYADYGSGRYWGLRYDAKERKLLSNQMLLHSRRSFPSSFGVDADGEVYVCAHQQGVIYRIQPKAE